MSSSEHKHNWTWNCTHTHQGILRTNNPLNSSEPLVSVSHVVIWNSALSASVSTQPAIKHACWTSRCVHHSARSAGTLAFWRWFLVCTSWPLAFFIFSQFIVLKKKKGYLKVWLRRKRPKSQAQTPTNQCKSVSQWSNNIVHNYQTATHIKGLLSFTLIILIRTFNVGMRTRKPHCC